MLYEHMRVARTPEELSRYFQKEFTHTRYGELYYDTVDGQACLCVEDGYLLSTPSNGIVWAKKGSEGKGQTCKFACMVLFKELEPKLVEWDMVAAVEDPVVLDATGNPTAVPPAANPTRALTAGSPDGDQRINSAPQVPEEESDSEPGQ